MKAFITCLLLVALLGIVFAVSFAQQNQNTQKPNPEVEALKNRISVLESKLQIVESVEKMELATKLAEANAKLANAEFGKLERDLRDSNEKWLIGWIIFFLTVLAVVGTPLWLLLKSGVNRIITNLKSNADQLIANEVGKSLKGFEAAVAQVNILQDQIRILEKEHTVSVLENSPEHYLRDESRHTEQINALQEEVLLRVFEDETRLLEIRCNAAEVLAAKKSPLLVSPLLEFLNSALDSDFDWIASFDTQHLPYRLVSSLAYIHTLESYEGLKQFLNRLLTENPEHKDMFLMWTVLSLAHVSIKLKKRESAPILRRTIPDLNVRSDEEHYLKNLAEHFDVFNEPEGIKEILTHHAAGKIPELEELEDKCLKLLQKHDPDFVEKWKAKKKTANTQNEESE